jgi:glycosyltransferase involved in cell wall biosynthesis
MHRSILIVLSTLFSIRGGIPRFNKMLCMAIDQLAPELGISGKVICQDDILEDYQAAGRPWRHLEFIPGGGRLELVARALSICVRQRPHLMLIGLLGMTPLGLLCSPFLRGGFGYMAHGFEVWDEPRITRRFAGRRARFAIAVSRHTAASLQRTVGLPADAILRLPNTLDPTFESSSAAPDESDDSGSQELLTVTRLWIGEEKKGIDVALRAFARLRDRHPLALFRIVGEGTDKPRLQKLAASLGLGESVLFEENLTDEELASRYRNCSVFVLPSGQEGFGIVFLEAMRFAKPCVGGNAGGTPDVILDGETGFLVPYGDVDALESTLDSLLADPELRRTIGRAGRRRLEEEFTFERFKERLSRYLVQLLEA